ncbi:hypothetical protein CIPAW_16G053500 [Carya illinoinensis]|uniref:Uncharacterized protein n=1 Tax=Carya illinoinensis TaxID=32201 RepID=A0A8T1N7U3_CARIL|nr:hypothetical protein CIPAW_16G053500 [Carya illinoinensis]
MGGTRVTPPHSETVMTNPISNPWLESCNKALFKKVVMYQAVSNSFHLDVGCITHTYLQMS